MVDSQPWENTVNTCLSWASLWVFLEFIVNWPDFMPNEKCVVSNGFIFCSPFVLWVVNTVCFDLTYLLLLWMCVFVPVHSQILVYFNLISPPQPCDYLETSCWMADGFTSDLLYFPSKDNTIFINEDLVLSMNRQRKRNVKLSCRRLIGRKELRGWSVRWLQ
jgi:hypothetical protein